MGLYSLMTTSASGMSAQSALLNAISDNVANVSTTGYKQATTEFSSLVLNSDLPSDYQSGSVIVDPQVEISGQGVLNSTTSTTDLAIQGNGFFIVNGPSNQPVLTRVGSFTKNAAGNLVNAAGYTLLGYPEGSTGVANSFLGLVPINLNSIALQSAPTTSGKLYVNLPSNNSTTVPASSGNLPSQNNSTSTQYTQKTSLVSYDNLGNQVTLDVYFTDEGSNTWDVAVYNAADATKGGFPYTDPATGQADQPLNVSSTTNPVNSGSTSYVPSATLNFSPTTGALEGIFDPTSGATTGPTSLTFTVPNGQPMTLDLSQTTQLATNYTVLAASTNGNAPSQVSGVAIAANGTVSVTYQNGSTISTFTVPLANVQSPDKMAVITGNAYVPGMGSGAVQIGTATSGGLGSIHSSTLESSTVDIATQLTEMIAAQNNYQANSKVFNTGSQLLQVLINLGH